MYSGRIYSFVSNVIGKGTIKLALDLIVPYTGVFFADSCDGDGFFCYADGVGISWSIDSQHARAIAWDSLRGGCRKAGVQENALARLIGIRIDNFLENGSSEVVSWAICGTICKALNVDPPDAHISGCLLAISDWNTNRLRLRPNGTYDLE